MSLILSSPAFQNGAIAAKYGKQSPDSQEGIPQLSFPLSWEGAPEGTQSYALVFIDYDNVIGEGIIWVHWLAANIPASASGLPEDAGRDPSLLQGKTTWAFQLGVDNPVCNRYGGPAPEDRPTSMSSSSSPSASSCPCSRDSIIMSSCGPSGARCWTAR